MLINKKDIISINQSVGEAGNVRNAGSLEFALSTVEKKPWLYSVAYLLRCLLIDHCFEDGNKRSAMGVLLVYFDYYNVEYDEEKVIKLVYKIAKDNIIDVNRIMRMVNNAIIK